MSALLERQGEVQEKLDAQDAWDLDSRLEMAMDALRCPPPDTPVKVLVRRRATSRRAVPFAAAKARHPFARRADKPSRRGVSRMARTSLAELRGHDHRRHSRSIFSRQRCRLDSRTRSRPGHSLERKLHFLARTKTGTAATRRKIGKRTTENTATRTRMDSHVAESSSRKRQSAGSTRTKICCDRNLRNAARIWRFTFRLDHDSATS